VVSLVEQAAKKKERFVLSDYLRVRTRALWEPVALFFNRLGLNPNTMTILGLVGNAIAAVLIARGNMFWGGVLILAMAPVDALDGTMARLRGQPTKFGAFVDSVTDRYSDLVIFGGLLVYYQQLNMGLEMLIVYTAAVGSVLVSYVRARGQSLGYDTKVGLFSRLERFLVLIPSLILNIPLVGAILIAVFGNITAIQRIMDVRRQALQDMPQKPLLGGKS
jgi:CDP-diacylglycerol---glycerol-3-phosphate 3-phosphatidyltransferase